MTAWHVVKDASKIGVRCEGRELVYATLAERSQTLDIAVLRTPMTDTPYLHIAPARSARVGDAVFAMGFPAMMELGPEPKFSDGAISALSGNGRDGLWLLITVPIQPGSSGSPVLSYDGSVVGIVTRSQREDQFRDDTGALPQNLNWGVKAEYITPLFDLPPPRNPAKTRGEAIERASKTVCIILADPGGSQEIK